MEMLREMGYGDRDSLVDDIRYDRRVTGRFGLRNLGDLDDSE